MLATSESTAGPDGEFAPVSSKGPAQAPGGKAGWFLARPLTIICWSAAIILALASSIFAGLQSPRARPLEMTTFLEDVGYPLERNAVRRLTAITADLRDVAMAADGSTIWAVGHRGTIVKSIDGGKSWRERPSGTTEDLKAVTATSDGKTVWVVGNAGTILTSGDGGDNWRSQKVIDADLLSVVFSPASQTLWSVGTKGAILKSDNRGQDWQAQESPTKDNLWHVAVSPSGKSLWAVGDNGQILKSVGGGDWEPVDRRIEGKQPLPTRRKQALPPRRPPPDSKLQETEPPSSGAPQQQQQQKQRVEQAPQAQVVAGLPSARAAQPHLRGALVLDDDTVWVVGYEGSILYTNNGADWSSESIEGEPVNLLKVSVAGKGGMLWAVGADGTILKRDGRGGWQRAKSGTLAILWGVASSVDGSTIWVVGYDGTLIKSSDHGGNWEAATNGVDMMLFGVASAGRAQWSVGANGTILKSLDEGETWRPTTKAMQVHFSAVAATSNGRTLWAVGTDGTIIRSLDGGDTWQLQHSEKDVKLLGVATSPGGRTVWAVGAQGTILKSINGGDLWQRRDPPEKANLNTVAVSSDGQTVWVAGASGTILRSADGGDTWALAPNASSENLYGLAASSDGRTLYVVGADGTVLKSASAGDSFDLQNSGLKTLLRGVTILPNGAVLAVGEDGLILKSANGGAPWEPRASRTRSTLQQVATSTDGRTAWTVGAGATVLKSTDDGETWQDPFSHYRRWPAPWYYASMLVVALLVAAPLLRPLPKEEIRTVETILDIATPDTPIDSPEKDRLGFRALVDALSNFLRNERTEPPLVLAVTAPWGQGKSSIMSMLRHELRAKGRETVWFNAWHHQKEEHLLASLLAAVRAQALPTWWRRRGIAVRWALLLQRVAEHPLPAALCAALFLVPVGMWCAKLLGGAPSLTPWMLWLGEVIAKASGTTDQQTVNQIAGAVSEQAQWLRWLAPLPGLLLTLRLGRNRLKDSGLDPGRLLAAMSGDARVKDLDTQISFRDRFAREFKRTTDALGTNTLTIFIDDLDRCKPEAVGEVLEAVNFLVSSGPCFVVLGYYREHVERAVGLHFSAIAAEVRVKESQRTASESKAAAEERAREQRRRYARNYLRKLVQIEVPVPRLEPDGAARILPNRSDSASASVSTTGSRWSQAKEQCARWLGKYLGLTMALVLLLVLTAIGFAIADHLPDAPRKSVPDSLVPDYVDPDKRRPPTVDRKVGGGVRGTLEDARQSSTFMREGQQSPWPWEIYGLAFLGALGLYALVAVRLQRREKEKTTIHDSDLFIDAVEAWKGVLEDCLSTPRELKRFVNEVRFFAARANVSRSSLAVPVSDQAVVGLAGLRVVDQYVNRQLDISLQPTAQQGDFDRWWESVKKSVAADRWQHDLQAASVQRAATDAQRVLEDYQRRKWTITNADRATFNYWSEGVRING